SVERGERDFAAGDRVIFLKNERGLGVKNGTLGTVEELTRQRLSVRLDDGRQVTFDLKDYAHVDQATRRGTAGTGRRAGWRSRNASRTKSGGSRVRPFSAMPAPWQCYSGPRGAGCGSPGSTATVWSPTNWAAPGPAGGSMPTTRTTRATSERTYRADPQLAHEAAGGSIRRAVRAKRLEGELRRDAPVRAERFVGAGPASTRSAKPPTEPATFRASGTSATAWVRWPRGWSATRRSSRSSPGRRRSSGSAASISAAASLVSWRSASGLISGGGSGSVCSERQRNGNSASRHIRPYEFQRSGPYTARERFSWFARPAQQQDREACVTHRRAQRGGRPRLVRESTAGKQDQPVVRRSPQTRSGAPAARTGRKIPAAAVSVHAAARCPGRPRSSPASRANAAHLERSGCQSAEVASRAQPAPAAIVTCRSSATRR